MKHICMQVMSQGIRTWQHALVLRFMEVASAESMRQPLKDGVMHELSGVGIAVRHTPGHTSGSITLLASGATRSNHPWMTLTGNLLFVGDVGWTGLVGLKATQSFFPY